MEKINVIPLPNNITFSDGFFDGGDIKKEITAEQALGDEGYRLIIEKNKITIRAQTEAGIFYGEKTLEQLRKGGKIPCLTAEDKPRFAYRGFMVDSARHMQSLEELKKIIDAAALFKFNKFHWHLSDDQGFRIESEKFPLLNEKGSWRKGDNFGNLKSDKIYGGYYKKSEIKEIVSYCAERFIQVIPELDLPGHTTAIISAYPDLSCTKKEIPVQTKQGIFEDILCAGDERTLPFVFELLEEILPLFPGEIFHIGGDEAPKARWEACPKCKAKMQAENLKNSEELQGWFTAQVVDFLAANGKKATVWNESLAGGNLPSGVFVQRWMDRKHHSEGWASKGEKIINSDFYRYYCDYPFYMTPLKKTYNYSPIPKGISKSMEEFVIGIEAPIWTEYIDNFEKLCYMIFPRFAAVAERAWTKDCLCKLKSFENRFEAVLPMLKAMGIEPAPISDCNPNTLKRLCGTIGFFKDKIDLKTLTNSVGTQN